MGGRRPCSLVRSHAPLSRMSFACVLASPFSVTCRIITSRFAAIRQSLSSLSVWHQAMKFRSTGWKSATTTCSYPGKKGRCAVSAIFHDTFSFSCFIQNPNKDQSVVTDFLTTGPQKRKHTRNSLQHFHSPPRVT